MIKSRTLFKLSRLALRDEDINKQEIYCLTWTKLRLFLGTEKYYLESREKGFFVFCESYEKKKGSSKEIVLRKHFLIRRLLRR